MMSKINFSIDCLGGLIIDEVTYSDNFESGKKKLYVTCAYIGNSMQTILDKMTEEVKDISESKASKKPEEYISEDKFKSITDPASYKKLLRLIKSGKLKIKK